MTKEEKVYMPQSTAGLVRYYDSSSKALKIRPEHVVGVSAILIAVELLLKFVHF